MRFSKDCHAGLLLSRHPGGDGRLFILTPDVHRFRTPGAGCRLLFYAGFSHFSQAVEDLQSCSDYSIPIPIPTPTPIFFEILI